MPNTRSRLGLIVTMKGFMTINSVQAGRVPATDEPKTASQSRRRFILGLTMGSASAALSACATPVVRQGAVDDEPPAETLEAEYQLGTEDELRVTVFGEPDLTGNYLIGSQGVVAFPLVGEVAATGLTIPQFTEQLRDALEAYIRRPIVSVEVANYRPFYILGEVANPGTYPYSARLTVQNAVATAGGFSYRANRRRVYIRHAGQTAERLYELTSNTPVLPGDTVRVPERLF